MEGEIYLGPQRNNNYSFSCSQEQQKNIQNNIQNNISESNIVKSINKSSKDDYHDFVNPCVNEVEEYLDYLEDELYNNSDCDKHFEEVTNSINNLYSNLSTGLELYNNYVYKILKKTKKTPVERNFLIEDDDQTTNLLIQNNLKNNKKKNEIEFIEDEINCYDSDELSYDSDFENERNKKERNYEDFYP